MNAFVYHSNDFPILTVGHMKVESILLLIREEMRTGSIVCQSPFSEAGMAHCYENHSVVHGLARLPRAA
jgi:hypothetical protein